MLVRSQALWNPLLSIDYRFEQTIGLWVRHQFTRAQRRTIPNVALLNYDKNSATENGFKNSYGAYHDSRMTLTLGTKYEPGDKIITTSVEAIRQLTMDLGVIYTLSAPMYASRLCPLRR